MKLGRFQIDVKPYFCRALLCLLILASQRSFAQIVGETQEIPRITLFLNEIRDVPVKGFRNFIITSSGVVEVTNLPSGILRVQATGPGSTIVYVWDSSGRRTFQFDVTGTTPNQSTSIRPGYDPAGSEFIYHMSVNTQNAGGQWASPFWLHEFTSSVPIRDTDEWRSLLRASTNAGRFSGDVELSPFSDSTGFDQMLSYYQTSNFNVAAGDVNYNPGELSILSFPLRGGSFQLYGNRMKDQLQFFGGLSRPQVRSSKLFNDTENQLYGVAGSKELASNVMLRSSFVYLNQPKTLSLFPGQTFQNEYVADVTMTARPFSDQWTIEGEVAKSKDDQAFRGLLEFTPYWGRILLSHKRLGKDYVKPARFSLFKNYHESNFITDVQATRKLGLLLNYQLVQIGEDPVQLIQKTRTHRVSLNTLYQKNEETSYIPGFEISRTQAPTTPQSYEQISLTYQHNDKDTKDQWFVQSYGRHSKNNFDQFYTERLGGGLDLRYTKNYSKILQMYLQNSAQMYHVHNTFPSADTGPNYVETILSLGPTVNYTPGNKTYSAGIFDTLIFRDAFGQLINQIQPFLSAYYNPSQALSVGSRLNYSIDPGNDYNFLSIIAELVYRFGSRVPDTLASTFSSSTKIKGYVFVDANSDGDYQVGEKLIESAQITVNGTAVKNSTGYFETKGAVGANIVGVELPKQYQAYQFNAANPAELNLFSNETKMLYFGISQRIPVNGKVILQNKKNGSEKGFEGAKIEITGPDQYKNLIETSQSGVYNIFIPEPGRYKFKLQEMDLPPGYKNAGPSEFVLMVKSDQLNKVPSFELTGTRKIIGRIFIDLDKNGVFDGNDKAVAKMKFKVGPYTLMTEDDGSFGISTIDSGTYDVFVGTKEHSGYQLLPFSDKLYIPDAGTIELNITYGK